jgi:acyl-CoA synthetase (AMP-forming)/AMP-acid ligase II
MGEASASRPPGSPEARPGPLAEAGLPAPCTLPELLRRNAIRHGGKPAVIGDDARVSHAELDAASRALAARLVAAGMTRSARVGLIMPNSAEWAVTAAAVMRAGATLVPLSTLLRPPELRAALGVASVTDLIVVPAYRGRQYLRDLDEAAPGVLALTSGGARHPALPFLRHVWRSSELATLGAAGSADRGVPPGLAAARAVVAALEAAVRPADDLAIVFTSGSRGLPKGVIHTHGNALRAVAASLRARRLGPEDRLYIPMPFFWTGGFAMGLISVLVAGATLLTEPGSDPEATIALLERERATLFRGWPDQAARIAAHPRFATADLSGLRPGSLPAVMGDRDRPAPGARANLLGMTETFGPYSGYRLDLDLPTAKHGSCGRPLAGIQVRITDPGTGREVPSGTDGEIRLRGPNLMRGICGRGQGETFDADGFYPTGDLGTVDGDGYLWLRGRLDDMFKVRGATVYPGEVESALRAIDGVSQAYVTSVPAGSGAGGDGAGGGDAVGAVVVSSRGPAEIAAAAVARLSSFKVPAWWLVLDSVEDVPRTPTGKVSPADVRQLLMERGHRR